MKKNIRSVEERKLIASRLKDLLTEKNIKPIQFCKEIGIEYNKLKSYYVGRSEPNIHILKTIEDKFQINSEYLLSGGGEKWIDGARTAPNIHSFISENSNINEVSINPKITEQLLNLPVYDLPVHANVGVGHNFEDLPMSYKPMNFGMKLDPLSAKVFRVSGDSMKDAYILSGAYIVIDTGSQPTNHNEVLANHNGVLIVKHFEQCENGFKLYSQNGGKHEYEIAENDYIEIVGVVKLVVNYR